MADELKCTCFRVRKTGRTVTRLYENALSRTGLTIAQFAVLAELQRTGGCGISRLGDLLGADRTTMTRTLERLQVAGWVSEEVGRDARLRRQVLTQKGNAAFRDAVAQWRKVETAMAQGMGAERLALLWELLGEADSLAAAAISEFSD